MANKEYLVIVKESAEELKKEIEKRLDEPTLTGGAWELVGGVSLSTILAPKQPEERPVLQKFFAQALRRNRQSISV